MKFRLLYEGEIAPRRRANIRDLHKIRTALEPQLRALWGFPPLAIEAPKLLQTEPADGQLNIVERRGEAVFIPIVSKKIDLQCGLDIIFLRTQAPGQLIGDGGDIDNRVKTLLDALAVPTLAQQNELSLPKLPDGQAFCCLLQDDSLVTKLSVETDRLLRSTDHHNDLVAIINVHVFASRLSFANLGIAN